jgi:hypothetical protein
MARFKHKTIKGNGSFMKYKLVNGEFSCPDDSPTIPEIMGSGLFVRIPDKEPAAQVEEVKEPVIEKEPEENENKPSPSLEGDRFSWRNPRKKKKKRE